MVFIAKEHTLVCPLTRNVHTCTHVLAPLSHACTLVRTRALHTHTRPLWLLPLLSSPAYLLDLGIHHQDYQVCQVLRPRHRLLTAAILPHGAAGDPVRDAASGGGQRHQSEGTKAT